MDLLGTSVDLRRAFKTIATHLCRGDDSLAFERLNRLTVSTIADRELRKRLDDRIRGAVYHEHGQDLDAEAVRLKLADWCVSLAGRRIDAAAFWTFLQTHRLARPDWRVPGPVAERLDTLNLQYLKWVSDELLGLSPIPRSEAESAVRSLVGEQRVAVLTAPAGYGKSGVVAQVILALKERGVLHAVLQADSLHGPATTDLGKALELPVSPVVALAGLAKGQRCVLLLDQLDAISELSGRSADRWPLVSALLDEAARVPEMRVLIACRCFDLHHDSRLRTLIHGPNPAKELEVGLLTEDAVRAAIRPIRPVPELSPQQLQILRVPLHLRLFVTMASEMRSTFGTVLELFSHYYKWKDVRVRNRIGPQARTGGALSRFAECLSMVGSSSIDSGVLDDYSAERDALLSEHVLVTDPAGGLRFFHDSFFDYVFARRFCSDRGDLIALLIGDGESESQHLFRRAQVRQILAYQRASNFNAYLRDLRRMLGDGRVRFHLKRAVLSGLSNLPDPRKEEWEVLEPYLTDPDETWRAHVLDVVWRRIPWFDLLESIGVFQDWLESPDEQVVDRAAYMIGSLTEFIESRPESIARLLRPHVSRRGRWDLRLHSLAARWKPMTDPALQSLIMEMIDAGVFDADIPTEGRNRSLWDMIHPRNGPTDPGTVRIVGEWIRRQIRRMELTRDESRGARFFAADRRSNGVLLKLANAHPGLFAAEIFPLVMWLTRRYVTIGLDDEIADEIWPTFRPGGMFDFREEVLEALAQALSTLAETDAESFIALTHGAESGSHQTVAYLLFRGWLGNPGRFADRAIAYLTKKRKRLLLRSYDDSGSSTAFVAQVISTLVQHCSPDSRLALERAILWIAPRWEQEARELRGTTELGLLSAMGTHNLSAQGRARVGELERKFPKVHPHAEVPRRRMLLDLFPDHVVARMTDDGWRGALTKFPVPLVPACDTQDFISRELHRTLWRQAASNPDRFIGLALRMDVRISPQYFNAILDGAVEALRVRHQQSPADVQSLRARVRPLIARMHGIDKRPCGISVCRAIKEIAVPSDPWLVDTAEWYAINGLEAIKDLEDAESNDITDANGGYPYTQGMSSARGTAAAALAGLLEVEPKLLDRLLPTIKRLLGDTSSAVRAPAIAILRPVFDLDPDLAVIMFNEACQGRDELVSSSVAADFVFPAMRTHYAQLQQLILGLLGGRDEETAAAVARAICEADLRGVPEAEHDAASVRRGSETLRSSAVAVYGALLDHPSIGRVCRKHFESLWHSDSSKVAHEVGGVFRGISMEYLQSNHAFVARYVESRAYELDPLDLIDSICDCVEDLPSIACRAAERALPAMAPHASSLQSLGMDANRVSEIVTRAYAQYRDEETRARCLDMIDQMERYRFFGLSELLEHWER